jgi:hypothetical protein
MRRAVQQSFVVGACCVHCRWLPQSCVFLALYGDSSSSSSSSGGMISGSSCLVAFHLASGLNHPAAWVALHPQQHSSTAAALQAGASTTPPPQPCCMEVLSMTSSTSVTLTSCSSGGERGGNTARSIQERSSSRKGGQGATMSASVAVGFSDGSSSVYHLDGSWLSAAEGLHADVKALQTLISS